MAPSGRRPAEEVTPAAERDSGTATTQNHEPPQEPPPSHADFTASLRQHTRPAAPQWGWRGRIHRWTGGRVSPRVSAAEQGWNAALRAVQMTFGGPRTIVFVNPKGGAFKTTATLMAGRTFGVHRGGGVVAIDNSEARGTLGERALPAGHANTARELLDHLDLFEGPAARLGDLGMFTRGQGPAHFDVLASDERPEITGQLDAESFDRLHELFRRYYRLVLVDSGNNLRAPNWLAAARHADLLVITTTVREDTASSALWMADALERHVLEAGALKRRSVALVCSPAPTIDLGLRRFLMETFAERCGVAMPIPFEPGLVGGGQIDYTRLSAVTHTAWLHACAAMATTLSPARES
ncbi:cobalamin biosynthesis protein CobQ [Streptomyces sp. 8K308]|nr:cobalamin biosynthesis protein CobQ [Streptomyces sp. 8K308]